MIEYELKNSIYQNQKIFIPSEKEEIIPLLPNVFSFHKILLMTRGISENIEPNHPHVEKLKLKLNSVMAMNDDNLFAILSQIRIIHQLYNQFAIGDAFRFTLLEETLFSYPDLNSLDTKLGKIEDLQIEENYWLAKYPLRDVNLPSFFPNLTCEIEFNIYPTTLHEYAIAFIHQLIKEENKANGDFSEILNNLILKISEDIDDYLT